MVLLLLPISTLHKSKYKDVCSRFYCTPTVCENVYNNFFKLYMNHMPNTFCLMM
ncbi:hypothetical protein HanPSC8_Chr08g0327881 [Helianthus annuus]|nr:hypothetical protein HanPSC8_Chr08g0327881 [Helianthus annuus]